MKIGILGTGLLGLAMAERLANSDCELAVYNRTKEKAEPLASLGVEISGTVEQLVRNSECILLILADMVAIEEVLFTEPNLRLDGKTVIQMGTIAPQQSIELQKKIFERGGEYMECPVLGSRPQAKAGKLILMAGATPDRFEKWKPLLKNFGAKIYYVGEVGKAAVVKLALNHLIASYAVTYSLSLGVVEKNGVAPEVFRDILSQSALHTSMFDNKFPNWVNRNYSEANFTARHLLKDVNLFLNEAESKQLDVKSVKAIQAVFEEAALSNLFAQDYSSVFNVVNKIP